MFKTKQLHFVLKIRLKKSKGKERWVWTTDTRKSDWSNWRNEKSVQTASSSPTFFLMQLEASRNTREERNCSYSKKTHSIKGLCVFHSLFPPTTRDAWISREPLAFRLIPPFLKSRASGSFLGLSSFPRMKDAIQIPWRWVRVTHNTRSKQGSKHSVAQRDERSWSWKQREEMLHDVVWISWWLLLLDTSSSRRWWRGQLCSLKSKYKSRWEEIERDRHSYLSSPSVSLLQGLPLGSFSFGFDTKKWVWKSSIHLVLDEANTMHYPIQCDG